MPWNTDRVPLQQVGGMKKVMEHIKIHSACSTPYNTGGLAVNKTKHAITN